MKTYLDVLTTSLYRLAKTNADQELVARTLQRLDDRYDLSRKIAQEPGLRDIIQQLMGRIYRAYGSFSAVEGQRILDIACGSNTSKYPTGSWASPVSSPDDYTVQFEPWFCRILLELGAEPVGIDIGDLEQESFEHHSVDLGQVGALNFLPDRSFDGVQDSRLFGSPEFTAQFPNPADRIRVAVEIWRQEQRLLKPGGVVIHSDAAELIGKT